LSRRRGRGMSGIRQVLTLLSIFLVMPIFWQLA
jgi:hypothetical protein